MSGTDHPHRGDFEPNRDLMRALREALAGAADTAKSTPMQRYMKSAMPFLGVPTPVMRRLARTVFGAYPLTDAATWQATALTLWREAAHREERYAAIELTGLRRYAPFQTLAALPMYQEMIVSGAWWDYVDALAIHRIGGLLRRHPEEVRSVLLAWRTDADLWLRRTAILSQVSFKQETDVALLYACIEPNLMDREFFIRKAIGWALRSYAWVDPEEVVRFVAEHERVISPLSRREALKNVGRRQREAKS